MDEKEFCTTHAPMLNITLSTGFELQLMCTDELVEIVKKHFNVETRPSDAQFREYVMDVIVNAIESAHPM